MTDGTTLSLGRLAGVVRIDRITRQATVWSGTRLRELTPALLKEGLALRTLASHDAQSVSSVLAADVHGTGREPPHTSDLVLAIGLVDGTGTLHENLGPDDERFKAAIGGIGALAVITRITLQCIDAFNHRQSTQVQSRESAELDLGDSSEMHEHGSFYAYPFPDLLHVHTWTRTDDRRSRLGAFRESLNESKPAVVAATLGDATVHWGLLPKTATSTTATGRPANTYAN